MFRRPETFSFVLEILYPFFLSSFLLLLSFFFSFILARHASGVAGIVGQGEHYVVLGCSCLCGLVSVYEQDSVYVSLRCGYCVLVAFYLTSEKRLVVLALW